MYDCFLFQAGLNGHIYKMPEIPEAFPELCDMKYSISNYFNLNRFFLDLQIRFSAQNAKVFGLFFFCLLLYTYLCLAPSAAPHHSLIQLSDLSENEDLLLEFFVSLPQLKQVTNDKEDLVTNIVDMASKFHVCPWSESKRCSSLVWFYKGVVSLIHREKPSNGATAGRKTTRNALQGQI